MKPASPLLPSLGLLLALLSTALPASAQQRPRAALPPVAGEVIVAFKPEAATLQKHALSARSDSGSVKTALEGRASALGARLGRSLEAGSAVGERMQVVRAQGVDAATLARELAAQPDVLWAQPNGRKRIVVAPNDPLYAASTRALGPNSGQWYLRAPDSEIRSAINIEAAWARTSGSANVVVAVLDTGVRFDHPDLSRRLLPGYDFVSNSTVGNDGDGRDADASDPGDWVTSADKGGSTFNDCAVADSSWHGTATASLVGAVANDSVGMAGSAPGVRVLPVRVLGKCFGSDADIIAAMRWAGGLAVDGVPANPFPAQVLNMSLGSSDGRACSTAYQTTVNELLARGVTVVAAAGNSNGGPVSEPANCAGAIGVLALRHVGTKVGFSDLGPEIGIAAPGGNCVNVAQGSACLYPILAATNSGAQGPATAIWSDSFNITLGTSFSSPLVAGVAALMLSRNPALSPAQLRGFLQSSARPFPTTGAGNGINGAPVPVCRTPSVGVVQDQCYCTTAVCGAGMLDAGAAVAAVAAAPFVSASFAPAAPAPGAAVSLTLTGLENTGGLPVQSYAWQLLDGGGAVVGFSSATNAESAAFTPTAAGTVRVRLTVTDTQGGSVSTDQALVVAAATPRQPPVSDSGDSGGGGSSGAWVLGVGLAAYVLRRQRSTSESRASQHKA
jgi:serine protease